MKKIQLFILLGLVFSLQACIATKLITVPVKVAYGTTKAVVKGTGAVVGAIIPDGDDSSEDKK